MQWTSPVAATTIISNGSIPDSSDNISASTIFLSYSKLIKLTYKTSGAVYYRLYPDPTMNLINVVSESGQFRKVAAQLTGNRGRVPVTQKFMISYLIPLLFL